ncbi:MAG: hypothetical protein KAS64_07385 [Spirochaetes bacterium]|nr:hypothetical protein [Spirochaetota bacterium]
MLRKFLLVIFVLIFASTFVLAEDSSSTKKSSDSGSTSFSHGLSIGAIVIDEVTYTQLIWTPDLKFGKFGIGLDVQLLLDQKFTKKDGELQGWQSFVTMIRYLSYGQKGEKVFVKIGNLDSASIGHGTVLGGFSNNVFYPELRLLGGQLDLDFGIFGFESFIENFLDLDIFAGRFYVRPLRGSGIPLIKNMAIGASYFTDLDPRHVAKVGGDKYKFDDNDASSPFSIYGIDVEVPLPNLGILTWKWFADYMQIQDKGNGFTTGIIGTFLGLFNVRAEYNRFSARFVSPFFDSYYLLERSFVDAATNTLTKYDSLDSIDKPYNGWHFRIWKSFMVNNKEAVSISLKYWANEIERPKAEFSIHLDRSLLFNKLEFDLYYSKKDIRNLQDALTIEGLNTIITWRTGYMVSENVMIAVTYMKTFIKNPDTGLLEGQESTSIQTELKF